MPIKIPAADKNLIQRYLLWCYKTTKEGLEKTDRKFTQIKVDRFILGALDAGKFNDRKSPEYLNLVGDFRKYIEAKEKDGLIQKFSEQNPKKLNPAYLYLENRLKAIEKAVVYFFGSRVLARFKEQYENEMTRRILESRDH